MALVVVDPPKALVDLALVKQHLRVEDSEQDVLILAYLAAACGHIDGLDAYLGRAIGRQVLAGSFDCMHARRLRLPLGPVLLVEAVSFINDSSEAVDWDPSNYSQEGDDVVLAAGADWPAGGITVRYAAGYEETPPAIVAAVLMMVGDLYANRESDRGVVVGPAAARLLGPYRVVRV